MIGMNWIPGFPTKRCTVFCVKSLVELTNGSERMRKGQDGAGNLTKMLEIRAGEEGMERKTVSLQL